MLYTKGEFYSGGKSPAGSFIEIFVNPTSNEIKDVKKNSSDSIRGVINNGEMYIWPAGILHYQINDVIKKEGKIINIDNFRFAYNPNNGWTLECQNIYTSEQVLEWFKKYNDLLSKIGDTSQTIQFSNPVNKDFSKYKFLGTGFLAVAKKKRLITKR
ncbi:MAG: hypothetical protein ACOCP8_09755 [archaeon]